MPVQKGKLKPVDEARVQQNFVYLLDEIDANYLSADLFSGGVFTFDDKEEISNKSSRSKRTEAMLDKILDSGPGPAFGVFMKALKRHYPHVADRLEATSVEETIPEDVYSWFCEIPSEIKEHVITDADASRYSGCFGDSWETIILRLGVSHAVIQQERQRNQGSVMSAVTALLIKWKQRVFRKATVEALLKVLQEVDLEGRSTINWDLVRNITLEKIEI